MKKIMANRPLDLFSSRDLLYSLFIIIILPNILFWLATYFFGLARPLFNFDYLVVMLLIAFDNRICKILAGLLFVPIVLIDISMLVMQVFPFMDFSAAIYLAPFLVDAPLRYIFASILFLLYILLMPFLLNKCVVSLKIPTLCIIFCCMLLMIGYPFRQLMYKEARLEFFANDDFYYMNSQLALYLENYSNDFLSLMRTEPVLKKGQEESAIKFLNQPYSDKILLIVAESWGMAKKPEIQKIMLEKIYDEKERLAFIRDGHFKFKGATVQGELRELCQLNVEGGFALHKLPAEKFITCLPNQLKQQGYRTVAMHGTSGQMYDRYDWYQKAGFKQLIFTENLFGLKRCHAFKGVCDSELFPQVSKVFGQSNHQKVFFYWLTLTSHSPFPESDMVNPRLDCEKFNIYKGDICNNMRLETQFFDNLAELIKQPEMKGVEVIVVGDHMPPIMGDKPLHKNLRWSEVSWLHFKVK